ncbi:MAG: flagellar motor protein MotA [Alphaproteobacteria bacterium]|nr:flagellar motor protein MotA [Alphaproteobacteria bacterium]
MAGPGRFLVRMVLFLVAVAAIAGALAQPLHSVFLHNPILNGVILIVMLIGIVFALRRVLVLRGEIDWMRKLQRVEPGLAVAQATTLLAPVAAMLADRAHDPAKRAISPAAARTLLDSLSSRLDESREISRYLAGLLIFLGLLGTFWGLLDTVSAVGGAVKSLNPQVNDFNALFNELQKGLTAPLSGMGTAFGSSLFGLSGSLVLGFLDLQAGQGQNQFFNDVEEWITGITKSSGIGDGEGSVPAYVQALLEQTAEGLSDLQRILQRSEERAGAANQAVSQLVDRLAALTDQMRGGQELMLRLADAQAGLRTILERLAEQGRAETGLDGASREHIRNLDHQLGRLVDEASRGRDQLIADLRAEIKLLARTIAALGEQRQG